MDIRHHNRTAWDRQVEDQHRWTRPVAYEEIKEARQGRWQLLLTPSKPVPQNWFPPLKGTRVLCLASGGGQQGPLLAAAGAVVTVFDHSPRQLDQDRFVCQREGLTIKTVEGDMSDLSSFSDSIFDLIVHPCSNCFVPDVRPVWRECARVLRTGGVLLSGFVNPVRYLFDDQKMPKGQFEVRYRIPYSDLDDLSEADLQGRFIVPLNPLEFGHNLTDQLAGQLDAGFVLTGFFEDGYSHSDADPISEFIQTFIATRAVKQ